MTLRYRISLKGLKGFARVYDLSARTTLYDFHKLLRDELDFPHDQLLQFKALDAGGGLVARYGLFDLGWGAVDAVTLKDTLDKGICSFIYFYDVTNKKSVIVTCEGEVEGGKDFPVLVESKGPLPADFENGYVAYEDLPESQRHVHEPHDEPAWAREAGDDAGLDDADDDIDDDDDEEEDDDEDGQVIYDGSEELDF